MKKRVGVWIRVSTDDQAKGESPKHHEERGRAYAQIKEWTVVEVYHLEAVSGKSVMNHPEAQRMLHDLRRGHITGLIFSKLARLARNTKELLEFAEIFKENQADLISLQESIDTSSPAGRFFYTLIAAMAEWERDEIASRVAASVPIRAKLGKPLGGAAPFGYKWEDKELVLDEKEAPIRRLAHELFAKHKRKRKVAQILNEKGYRTRNGGKFTGTTLDRFFRDPVAKGLRRANYTKSTGEGKAWELKPQEDWVLHEVPRIISDELWDECNRILDEMAASNTKVRRKGVHLFSGLVSCVCGHKMYLRAKSPRYICTNCKNKIPPDTLEEIFLSQLKGFLFSDVEIQKHLNEEQLRVEEKKKLLKTLESDYSKVKAKIDNLLELFHEAKVSKEAFEEYHTPLYEELKQKEASKLELQTEIDNLQMLSLNNDQVIHDARNLHARWNDFTKEDKKLIIETITHSIVVDEQEVHLTFSYIPTLVAKEEMDKRPNSSSPIISVIMPHNHRDSLRRPASGWQEIPRSSLPWIYALFFLPMVDGEPPELFF